MDAIDDGIEADAAAGRQNDAIEALRQEMKIMSPQGRTELVADILMGYCWECGRELRNKKAWFAICAKCKA